MSEPQDMQAVLDALGHGVLIFASSGALVRHNLMAGIILGTDLNLIKAQGWAMASELFDRESQSVDVRLSTIRDRALESDRPVRFHIYRSGNYIPCWAGAVTGDDGDVYLMLTLDVPDWSVVSRVIDRFRDEMSGVVESTVGHINLINRTLKVGQDQQDEASAKIARRIGGFTKLIEVHMTRAGRLMNLLDRFQALRTGAVRQQVLDSRKQVNLQDFLEDFIEALDEIQLLDPESEPQDYRSRIQVQGGDGLRLHVAPAYLQAALREILRNAVMYSLVGTPITITAQKKSATKVQLDVQDEGYGIRESGLDAVFTPFARAQQPQIIGEFGYGLALHLCKHEIEAMNGNLWFETTEGVGSTFSLLLPLWQDNDDDQEHEA